MCALRGRLGILGEMGLLIWRFYYSGASINAAEVLLVWIRLIHLDPASYETTEVMFF